MIATFLSQPVVFGCSWAEVLSVIGVVAILFTALTALVRYWRHHECHVDGCHRVQWKTVPGTTHVVCKHHHVEDAPSHADVLRDHRRSPTNRRS